MNRSTTYAGITSTTSKALAFEGVKYPLEQDFYPWFSGCDSTGKELDAETGYGYFGARYYDATLMTSWTAVDPMSDKYPNISPYAYCAWNPVKLVDPDGRDVEIIKNDGDKTITIRSNFYYNKAQLGAEADVFLAGFKVALGSWENDIRTALGDESLGVSDYSINFEFGYIECDNAKKSANNDRIGNSLSNDPDCSANAIVTNNKHFSANISLHSQGCYQDADPLFYGTLDYQGTLKHEIGHFFGLFDRYPKPGNPAPSIPNDLMDYRVETRQNAVEPFKRVWHSVGLNNGNSSVLINSKNRERW